MQARLLGFHILFAVNRKSGSGAVLCECRDIELVPPPTHEPHVAAADKEAHLADNIDKSLNKAQWCTASVR